MHLVRLSDSQDTQVADATAPAFSADSRWVAYQIDPNSGGRGGRGGRGGGAPAGAPAGQGTRGGQGAAPVVPRRVELRNLETGAVQAWQDMQSFTFAGTSCMGAPIRTVDASSAATAYPNWSPTEGDGFKYTCWRPTVL